MKVNNLSDQPDILRAALVGYQIRQEEVERKIRDVEFMLAEKELDRINIRLAYMDTPLAHELDWRPGDPKPKRRTMSPEARERIAAATRLRWKRYRREKRKAA